MKNATVIPETQNEAQIQIIITENARKCLLLENAKLNQIVSKHGNEAARAKLIAATIYIDEKIYELKGLLAEANSLTNDNYR
ncbi:hypothetical protein ACFQNF_19620 [Iodobacter arcticus]|uniref:Uncharacterized protein n=1 Tax=Iodobacter arcticus TaxID=590593 RepID=A0ABW2R2D1_9NEIS